MWDSFLRVPPKYDHFFKETERSIALLILMGFPGGSDGKESACNAGDLGSTSGLGDPRRREWQPTPVFLPRESYGQRSLAGYLLSMESKRVGHD